jgi:hypothetical protein
MLIIENNSRKQNLSTEVPCGLITTPNGFDPNPTGVLGARIIPYQSLFHSRTGVEEDRR